MVVENIACSIAATVIYEGLKGIGSYFKKEYQYGNKQSGERAIINNIVKGKYNREFDELVESSLFNKFMSSPQVFDLLRDYIQYTATNRTKGYLKLAKNKIKQTNEIKESDIVEYLVEQYSKMAEVEDKSIDKIKFKRYLEYIFICLEDL